MFSPLPAWDGMHPLVVHFPIALLLTAPIFVILGMAIREGRVWSMGALLLMVLGTVGILVAMSTGEAAEEVVQVGGGAEATLERHEELAELARNLFIGLTLVFGAIVCGPKLLRERWTRTVSIVVQCVFLVAYLGSAAVLANAAHEGGRLVHEFGIHASRPSPGAEAPLDALTGDGD
jgi:uncharacterized membrane protein